MCSVYPVMEFMYFIWCGLRFLCRDDECCLPCWWGKVNEGGGVMLLSLLCCCCCLCRKSAAPACSVGTGGGAIRGLPVVNVDDSRGAACTVESRGAAPNNNTAVAMQSILEAELSRRGAGRALLAGTAPRTLLTLTRCCRLLCYRWTTQTKSLLLVMG